MSSSEPSSSSSSLPLKEEKKHSGSSSKISFPSLRRKHSSKNSLSTTLQNQGDASSEYEGEESSFVTESVDESIIIGPDSIESINNIENTSSSPTLTFQQQPPTPKKKSHRKMSLSLTSTGNVPSSNNNNDNNNITTPTITEPSTESITMATTTTTTLPLSSLDGVEEYGMMNGVNQQMWQLIILLTQKFSQIEQYLKDLQPDTLPTQTLISILDLTQQMNSNMKKTKNNNNNNNTHISTNDPSTALLLEEIKNNHEKELLHKEREILLLQQTMTKIDTSTNYMLNELDVLKKENEKLKKENTLLKSQIQSNQIRKVNDQLTSSSTSVSPLVASNIPSSFIMSPHTINQMVQSTINPGCFEFISSSSSSSIKKK